jgi:hypothetical protein
MKEHGVQYAHFFALLIGGAVFWIVVEVHRVVVDSRDPHSPNFGIRFWAQVLSLVRRETSHETDDETTGETGDETTDVDDHGWGYIEHPAQTEETGADDPEPLSQLERFVKEQDGNGVPTTAILRAAMKKFGASKATFYRALKKVREL